MTATVDFLGLRFTPLICAEAASDFITRPADAPFACVVAPTVDHILDLARDPGLGAVYGEAWRTLNDSRTLEGLARRSGLSLPVCAAGDLVRVLFELHINRAETVTIVGASEAVITRLQARYGLKDVRWHAPPMDLDAAALARAAAFIAAQRARFVFIAGQSPQQEMIAKAAHDRGDATGIGLCCGESLAELAGLRRVTPDWMRDARLGWLHRLATDPGRFGERALTDGPAVLSLWLRWRAAQRRAAMASRSSR